MLRAGSSFETAWVKTSVMVNGVAVRLPGVPAAVQRFSRPATFHAEGHMPDIFVAGSTLFLRYRARNFGICTLHQLGTGSGKQPSSAYTLVIDDGGKKIGVSPVEAGQARFHREEHENLSDIFLARFEDERNGRPLRPHFLELDLEKSLRTVPEAAVRSIFAIGYPTEAGSLEPELDEDYVIRGASGWSRWVKVHLQRTQRDDWDLPNRLPLAMDPRSEGVLSNPDGMSGAPVFFAYTVESKQFYLGLAGFISHANAGRRRFALYGVEYIRAVLDEAIDGPAA